MTALIESGFFFLIQVFLFRILWTDRQEHLVQQSAFYFFIHPKQDNTEISDM